MDPIKVRAFYSVFYGNGKHIAHCCQSILEGMYSAGLSAEYWSTAFPPGAPLNIGKSAVPHIVYRAFCKLGGPDRPSWNRVFHKFVETRYLRSLNSSDIAYLWPATSLQARHIAQKRAALTVAEQVNCTHAYRTPLLKEAYGRLDWPYPFKDSNEVNEQEAQLLNACDKVFAPSPAVAASLLKIGIPEEQILHTSYGWSPPRFEGERRLYEADKGTNFLFVGSGRVRKGLPWLLRVWDRAKINGKLILMLFGPTEHPIEEEFAHIINREDVLLPNQHHSIGEVYRSADVFVFPTHEEGSPLVSYEALGCGLPCLVSPMGAGDVIRDGVEGFVLNPYDEDAWINAMHKLAEDTELRQNMSQAARARAKHFTWDAVGKRRGEQLAQIIANL